jgi:hypothetical protein
VLQGIVMRWEKNVDFWKGCATENHGDWEATRRRLLELGRRGEAIEKYSSPVFVMRI